jgi:hypothetical protein
LVVVHVTSLARLSGAIRRYRRRRPETTPLYRLLQQHLDGFLARLEADPAATHWPRFVRRELDSYLGCGILAHGFARVHCDACGKDALVAFS